MTHFRRDSDNFEVQDSLDRDLAWVIATYGDGFVEVPPHIPTAEELAVAAETKRIDALWQGAHDYEYASISGSAIGLVAIGIMTGKPKCLAVQAWVAAIWTEYYARKAGASTDNDFTNVGSCPYTVPELMAELGL